MHLKSLRRYFLGIVLPSILAVILFIISFYIIIIPSFEKKMMDGKRDMIRELTQSALSLVREFHDESMEGDITEDEAKVLAARRIGQMRYGKEGKDYFWITDMRPSMVMHP